MTTRNTTAASRSRRPTRKYFTLSEANRAIPYVARIMTDITDSYTRAVHIRQRMDEPITEADAAAMQNQYEQLMDRLNDLVDEVTQVGCELKDFEKGLLDFPARFQGREIYLCWHLGEPSITHWHEVDAGFSGRQDVALLDRE